MASAAAVLGLLVQLVLPFSPMPLWQIQAPETRAEAIALWGPDSLCTAQDGQSHDGHRHDGSLHCDQCLFCQAQHQLAQLLAPLPGQLPLPRVELAGRLQVREFQAWSDRTIAHRRSRAPPVVLT